MQSRDTARRKQEGLPNPRLRRLGAHSSALAGLAPFLATAKGDYTLAVLQEKLPARIRPLGVALLSDERDGMKQFEHSIQTIASSVNFTAAPVPCPGSMLTPVNKTREDLLEHDFCFQSVRER